MPGSSPKREQVALMPRGLVAENKPRPPTLPADLFKPKGSLSQCFMADPNYIWKITREVDDESPNGRRLIELGPGTGALTVGLLKRYPEMIGIELDQRAIRQLAVNAPGAHVIRTDALLVNYTKVAEIRGGPLTIIGNLPYHVTSQILFALADHSASIRKAYVTMQWEVAKRIVAKPGCKAYNTLSVAFQLYADCKLLFDIPPNAFFPRPSVNSAFVEIDFEAARERREAMEVDPRDLRNVTNTVFGHRSRMLRNSLVGLLGCHTTKIRRLPPEYEELRPHFLEPQEHVRLTQELFGKKPFPRHLRRAWRGEYGRVVRDNPSHL